MSFSKIVDNKIKIIAINSNDVMKNKGLKLHNPTIASIENALDIAEASKFEFIYLIGKIPKEVTKYYTFLDNYTQENKIKESKGNVIYGNFPRNTKTIQLDTNATILPLRSK